MICLFVFVVYLFISFFPIRLSMYYFSVCCVLNVFIHSFIVLIIYIHVYMLRIFTDISIDIITHLRIL